MRGASTLAGERVAVTGAGGFIGGHLCERLVAGGAWVRALVESPEQAGRPPLDRLARGERLCCATCDVVDLASVAEALDGSRIVFHLAGLADVEGSFERPADYVRVHALGTLNVLEAVRAAPGGRAVIASSSQVYGAPARLPIAEDSPLEARSPYAATKIAAERLAESYRRGRGTEVVVLRLFASYGPRQATRAVVPEIIGQLLAGPRLRLGNTEPTRDLLYVSDVARAFVAAALAAGIPEGPINICSGREVSIGTLAEMVARLIGREPVLERDPARIRPPDREIDRQVGDRLLARRALGWEPRISLEEGLRRTIEGYSEQGAERRSRGEV